jgi:hypothetical protein
LCDQDSPRQARDKLLILFVVRPGFLPEADKLLIPLGNKKSPNEGAFLFPTRISLGKLGINFSSCSVEIVAFISVWIQKKPLISERLSVVRPGFPSASSG